MTVREFDNGYWYAVELRHFARDLGILEASRLRKDELEAAIRAFLSTGEVTTPARRTGKNRGIRDVARGLTRSLSVSVYTNDKETREFIEREARKAVPALKKRSGARYRLNRWREAQIESGRPITYGDVVDEYIRLCQSTEPFARVPHGRYINFVADFLAGEKGASRKDAVRAWKALKEMELPKDYRSWLASKSR